MKERKQKGRRVGGERAGHREESDHHHRIMETDESDHLIL